MTWNGTDKKKDNANLWIGDSGNSHHLTNSDEGMIDWVDIHEPIKLADNKTIWAKKKGTIPFRVITTDGEEYDYDMEDAYYVPDLGPYNLFSITMGLDNHRRPGLGMFFGLTNSSEIFFA